MDTLFMRIRRWCVGLLVLFLLYTLFAKANGFFSPTTLCRINIHGDIISGNERTIKQAINMLFREDKNSYRLLCANVDRIYEKVCRGTDWNLDKTYTGLKSPGCYVRGSRSVYIIPERGESEVVVQNRARALKALAEDGSRYWNGR